MLGQEFQLSTPWVKRKQTRFLPDLPHIMSNSRTQRGLPVYLPEISFVLLVLSSVVLSYLIFTQPPHARTHTLLCSFDHFLKIAFFFFNQCLKKGWSEPPGGSWHHQCKCFPSAAEQNAETFLLEFKVPQISIRENFQVLIFTIKLNLVDSEKTKNKIK